MRTSNGIKNLKKGSAIAEDPGYTIKIAKETIKGFLGKIGKIILINLSSYILILVLSIMAAGVVFEMFAFFKNLTNPFDIDVNEMRAWANELTDKEIEEMLEYGANIHPQKIGTYLEIEENSYLKNITIKVPIITKTWENGALVSETKEYVDYLLKRGDVTYPYRQWWQSTAVIDIINETAINKSNWKIVNDAEKKLNPILKWLNPIVPKMKEGDEYKEKNGLETVITTTTVTEKKTGEETIIIKREIKEYYPVVHLKEVETMFAIYQFEFEDDIETKGNDNFEIIIEDIKIQNTTKEFIDKFMVFMDRNNIDINSDPEIMYLMTEEFPQNYDFLNELEDYLYYIDDMFLYGEFRGGFGRYEGQYEILPSDLIRDIPLFLQTDPRWAEISYSYSKSSGGTIKSSGCGPTSAAMVITGLGGYNANIDLNGDSIIDPYESAVYAVKKGHRVKGGTTWSYFADIGKAVNLNVKQKNPNQYKEVLSALQNGDPVIAAMGPGVFTKKGHFIVLIGINENGKVIVNDPNSTNRSNVAWDFYNPLLAQVSQFWIFSK